MRGPGDWPQRNDQSPRPLPSPSPRKRATTFTHLRPAAASAHRRQAALRLLRCASPLRARPKGVRRDARLSTGYGRRARIGHGRPRRFRIAMCESDSPRAGRGRGCRQGASTPSSHAPNTTHAVAPMRRIRRHPCDRRPNRAASDTQNLSDCYRYQSHLSSPRGRGPEAVGDSPRSGRNGRQR